MLIVLPGGGPSVLLLACRRPENAMGWVLLGVALLPAIGMLLPIESQTGSLGFGVAVMLVLFPTGTLPGRVWLIPLVGAGVCGDPGGLIAIGLIVFGDFGLLDWGADRRGCAGVVCGGPGGAVSDEHPFRSVLNCAGWAFAAAAAGVGVVCAGLGLVFGQGTAVGGLSLGSPHSWSLGTLLFGFPGAILIAVLRYRLYEIDRVVSRTVTFAVVVGLVSAIYAVPAALIPRLIGSSSDLVTAGATLPPLPPSRRCGGGCGAPSSGASIGRRSMPATRSTRWRPRSGTKWMPAFCRTASWRRSWARCSRAQSRCGWRRSTEPRSVPRSEGEGRDRRGRRSARCRRVDRGHEHDRFLLTDWGQLLLAAGIFGSAFLWIALALRSVHPGAVAFLGRLALGAAALSLLPAGAVSRGVP